MDSDGTSSPEAGDSLAVAAGLVPPEGSPGTSPPLPAGGPAAGLVDTGCPGVAGFDPAGLPGVAGVLPGDVAPAEAGTPGLAVPGVVSVAGG
ncbi:MAG: hypothetical protein ACKOJF_03935, partial [Planctomycetaceae bacterium]